MLAADDINVGMFVAICGETKTRDIELPWVFNEGSRYSAIYGQPYKVVGINLPFIAVRYKDGEANPLDIRNVQLTRLDEDYVAALLGKKFVEKEKPLAEPDRLEIAAGVAVVGDTTLILSDVRRLEWRGGKIVHYDQDNVGRFISTNWDDDYGQYAARKINDNMGGEQHERTEE